MSYRTGAANIRCRIREVFCLNSSPIGIFTICGIIATVTPRL
ncbi:MAG TPA: hypothetical protein ENH82_16035 [bacterium]|nr:hypothetical protein [bacterium]